MKLINTNEIISLLTSLENNHYMDYVNNNSPKIRYPQRTRTI